MIDPIRVREMRNFIRAISTILAGVLAGSAVCAAEVTGSSEAALAAIRAQVAEVRQKLGARAGVPEEPDKYTAIPKNARWLTPAEAQGAFAKRIPTLEAVRWWKVGLDPTKLTHPLREPAEVISGAVAAVQAQLDGAGRGLELAREAAVFLQWAQTEAGAGVFPFPAAREVKGARAFTAAEGFFIKAERAGRLHEVIRRGWCFEDGGDGGLQFDNGEAGLAMFDLHALTKEPAHLESARQAADWAASRSLSRNWNYNSFSVALLARAFAVTGETRYLAAATHKARVGVIPGQLVDGPRAGRWLDPHNAKPTYHYIMMRALTELVAVLPAGDSARVEVVGALRLGLRARNVDLLGPGAANKDMAMEALLRVHEVFGRDAAFLRDTHTTAALDALGRLVSDQYRRGGQPLGPRSWGLFLAHAKARETSGR